MDSTSRSSLNNRTLVMIGFGFVPHPTKKRYFIQMSFYKVKQRNCLTSEYVIAVSEGPGTGNVAMAKSGLGKEILGQFIAPFAARNLKGIELAELKRIFQTGYPKAEFHWHE